MPTPGVKESNLHLFFDLDGTLVDSRERFFDAYQSVLETWGLKAIDQEQFDGRIATGRLLTELNLSNQEQQSFWGQFMARFVSSNVPSYIIPGVEDALSSLRTTGQKMYVLTGRVYKESELSLELEDIGIRSYFEQIFCVEPTHGITFDAENMQDKKDLFAKACDSIGIPSYNGAYVSDWPVDLQKGQEFGFRKCFGVLTGKYSPIDFVKIDSVEVIPSVADLAMALWRINARYASPPPEAYLKETDRLRIRNFCPNDINNVYSLASGRIDTRYLNWEIHTSLSDSQQYVQFAIGSWKLADALLFFMETKTERWPVGWIGIDAIDWTKRSGHLRYCLATEFEGHGVMTEAVKAIVSLFIDILGFREIYALVHMANTASSRVMEKTGFVESKGDHGKFGMEQYKYFVTRMAKGY